MEANKGFHLLPKIDAIAFQNVCSLPITTKLSLNPSYKLISRQMGVSYIPNTVQYSEWLIKNEYCSKEKFGNCENES